MVLQLSGIESETPTPTLRRKLVTIDTCLAESPLVSITDDEDVDSASGREGVALPFAISFRLALFFGASCLHDEINCNVCLGEIIASTYVEHRPYKYNLRDDWWTSFGLQINY